MDHHESDQGPSFEEGVTKIMVACEELRQQIKQGSSDNTTVPVIIDIAVGGREDLDIIFENLGGMHQLLMAVGDNINDEELQMRRDLFHHCQQKVAEVARLFLQRLFESTEPSEDGSPNENDVDEAQARQQLETERRDFQASIARVTELNLILCLETGENEKLTEIVQKYVAYQRKTVRERSKPFIAKLVQDRREKANKPSLEILPHSHVITAILGQASALIHPLLVWMFSLPPPPAGAKQEENKLVEAIRQLCTDSIEILDEQAQTLTKTVSDWFWEDRKVDEWMAKSNSEDTLDHEQDRKYFLGELDGLVEEMAFICQVIDRYKALMQGFPKKLQSTIEQELSPEWTWKYATLERFLITQQWKSALILASPVHIVLGTSIQVPSVVEDAQYLSTRALERAASTRSTQAIGTVAHSISSHVWSTDISGGVNQALNEQVGCFVDEGWQEEPKKEESASKPAASSNSFASALLDALDDDISKDIDNSSAPKKPTRAPSNAPSSGLLSSLVGGGDGLQQIRINTDFCSLNGIHSASTACHSLVKFLNGLLENPESIGSGEEGSHTTEETNNMIQLAREELSNYSTAYEQMLKCQVKHVIEKWCGSIENAPKRRKGPCLPLVRNFFENESFELDSSAFKKAEADIRLEDELLGPLDESKFLQQLGDKCDEDVLFCIREELTIILADLVLGCLLHSEIRKRFTDWGSLLLSKEVRLLQAFLSRLLENTSSQPEKRQSPAAFQAWERLSQVVTVLQLEKPSDWILYQSTSVLTPEELRTAMHLRVDFSADAIDTVVGNSPG